MKVRRRGFTLVELLVTIAVIGVLLGLALPAVMMGHGAVRRMQCASRLRQIAIAMHAYESQQGVYPSAAFERYGGPSMWGPLVQILPYMEQNAAFDAVNFRAYDYAAGENTTVMNVRIAGFLCPSDGGRPQSLYVEAAGHCSYRVNTGPSVYFEPFVEPRLGKGAFEARRWLRGSDFDDGLSHTAMASEKLLGDGEDSVFHAQRDWYYLSNTSGTTLSDELRRRCEAEAPGNGHKSYYGQTWLYAGAMFTSYNHAMTPNSTTPDCGVSGQHELPPAEGTMLPGLRTARSLHGSGVNCVRMDGSVEFVSDAVDLRVWQGLSTRASGDAGL